MTYETDEERLDAIRRWWADYGRAVTAGVVIAVVLLVGWQQWRAYEVRQAEAASREYQALVQALAGGNAAEGAVLRGADIVRDFPRTPYATLAAFRLAQYHAERGELEPALAQLEWVVDKGRPQLMRDIARLRTARVALALGRHDRAQSVLRAVTAPEHASMVAELRGDVHFARGETAQAAAAYREAMTQADNADQRRGLLQMKLDEVERQG